VLDAVDAVEVGDDGLVAVEAVVLAGQLRGELALLRQDVLAPRV
jgi:hypothetical protein